MARLLLLSSRRCLPFVPCIASLRACAEKVRVVLVRPSIARSQPLDHPSLAPLLGLDAALRAFAAHPEGLDAEGRAALMALTAAWYERQCALSRPPADREWGRDTRRGQA